MCRRTRRLRSNVLVAHFFRVTLSLCFLAVVARPVTAIHHSKIRPPPRNITGRQASANVPLIVTNQCAETIYPGLLTQSGVGPGTGGFQLTPGSNKSMTVSHDWQGRVWGRTNCSFSGNSGSGSCGSGDCTGGVSCSGTGQVPTTLAEFTLDAGDGHSYYDLSLVDGYNLPMAIVMISNSVSSLQAIPKNLTNPSCVGTVGNLASQSFNPYTNGSGSFLGTNSGDPLPFEKTVTLSEVAQWCPFALQLSSSISPSGGVYIYPDGILNRPQFDPCYSACSKYNLPVDCCTGSYDSPSVCIPSAYSKAAKTVCPDAYSYAFDDQTSTFIIPAGAGFQVVFCPGGRSTNIISTSKGKLVQLSQLALLGQLGLGSLAYHDDSANTTSHAGANAPSFACEPPRRGPTPNIPHLDEKAVPTIPTMTTANPVQVVTSTVLALPGSATSYSATAWTIIDQWHGTGLFGNYSESSARPTRDLQPGNRLGYSISVAGFMLWIAW